jgi:hypothetical protein
VKFNQLREFNHRLSTVIDATDPNASVWVIGDVHGCAEEFERLCQRIVNIEPDSTIIQLGDLIDRGPYFAEVFDVIEKYNVKSTIGNHELNFLLEHHGMKRCNSHARWESHDRMGRLSNDQQERIIQHMQSMYNYIVVHTDEDELINKRWWLSHAPITDVEAMSPNPPVRNAWSYCSRNQPYNDDSFYQSLDFAAHGHQHWNYTNVDEQMALCLKGEKSMFNVDGGCVYGGELVAMDILSLTTLKEVAHETYFG